MAKDNLHRILEALLFASEIPLTPDRLKEALEGPGVKEIRAALNKLNQFYDSSGSAIKVIELAGGYQLLSRTEYAPVIQKLFRSKSSPRLTQRALETLAIVAYKQPLTKMEMEAIRGVNVDGVVKTLLERNLVKIEGRQKAPGNPLLYGTTRFFLQYFGLHSLSDLPKLKEIDELLKDDEKFLESLDQVSLQQIAPEALGMRVGGAPEKKQTELEIPDNSGGPEIDEEADNDETE